MKMGHDEARKLWEVFDGCSKEVQADYMNERYGDVAYDQTREISEEQNAEEIENLLVKLKGSHISKYLEENVYHLQPPEVRDFLLKTSILENVYDCHFDPQTNVVDVLVCRLRRQIDHPFEEKLIHTVRGAGYVLKKK